MQKQHFTAEEIARQTEHLNGLANIRAINKIYRAQDESHLWPVSSRFNATDRAIGRVSRFSRQAGAIYGLEYCYSIEQQLSEIVNNI
jgi:hypothetical protein